MATTAATAEALPPLTWNALTLENGWSDFGGFGEPAAGYAVDAQGVVYFRGVIHGGSGAAFTLPTSVYNFNDSIYLPAMVGDGPTSGLLMILDGTAYPKDGSSASGLASNLDEPRRPQLRRILTWPGIVSRFAQPHDARSDHDRFCHRYGIKTVLHPVSDLATAKEMYAALLGVSPQTDEAYYVGFETAGQQIGLVPSSGPQAMTSPWPIGTCRTSRRSWPR